jgi:hypothetical protein
MGELRDVKLGKEEVQVRFNHYNPGNQTESTEKLCKQEEVSVKLQIATAFIYTSNSQLEDIPENIPFTIV